MGIAIDFARAIIPRRARRLARELPRRQALARAIARLTDLPAGASLPHAIACDLVYGWANGQMSASPEFVQAIWRCALQTSGPVLECGSGITTLVLSLAAQRAGYHVWSLEHDPFWARIARASLARHGLTGVTICDAPLRGYGEFAWYDPRKAALPADFSLVICDGPPGTTPGGRYGLIPVLGSQLRPGCVILLDDATRAGEQGVLARWGSELNVQHQVLGHEKPYAQLAMPGRNCVHVVSL